MTECRNREPKASPVMINTPPTRVRPKRTQTPCQSCRFPGLLVKALLLAWLLASMLFAHGCHGNEDHELFDTAADWIAAKK
jgi:hypothetical protein